MTPGASMFDRLVAAVRECMDSREAPRADPTVVAVGLWIGLLGIVSLQLSKPSFPWPPVEHMGDRVLLGLVAASEPR